MRLPQMPYRSGATRQEIVAFGGLDRTENTREGELRDSAGIVSEHYPIMTQRLPREAVEGYTDPTDIYNWDGRLIVVTAAGTLYVDGEAVGELDPATAGQKQFAAVNSRMCIWPDKVMLDMDAFNHPEDDPVYIEDMVTHIQISGENVVMLEETGIIVKNAKEASLIAGRDIWDDEIPYYTYTYGKDPKAVAACWIDGAWDMEALGMLQRKRYFVNWGNPKSVITPGDIFIPSLDSGRYDYLWGDGGHAIDTDEYNDVGHYGVFLRAGDVGVNYFDVYDAAKNINLVTDMFGVGDTVSISGTTLGIGDKEQVTISSIDVSANAIRWGASDAVIVPARYGIAEADYVPEDVIILEHGAEEVPFIVGNKGIPMGMVLYYNTHEDGDPVYVWDPAKKEIVAQYSIENNLSSENTIATLAYDAGNPGPVVIRRSVPDLDYICGHDNRLWGVSNTPTGGGGRTIYASSLGKPWQFWTFAGVDTDAWQVAVGSAGRFTGICAYNGGVCCWKEDRLHKILGGYPSEYYMNEYRLEGVGRGNWRSLAVINETLYYSGRHGVYSYNGGIPTYIGYNLHGPVSDAVGISNGKDYYLAGTLDDEKVLLVYDTTHRLWMKEDDIDVSAFAMGDSLYMLVSGDNEPVILKAGQGDETVSWYADFVPFDEVATLHKYYLRLVMRLDRTAGSTVNVEFSTDGGEWRTVYEGAPVTDDQVLETVSLPLTRCDRLGIRLSGTGRTAVRAMTREYVGGSERR